MLTDTALDTETSPAATRENHRLALLWVFPEVRCHVLEPGKGPWRLGRGEACEIFVADHRASREHAEIAFKGPVILLRDLESTNGTFVDGAEIGEVPIQAGSIVRIGGQLGIFCMVPVGSDATAWFRELSPGYFAGPALQRILEPVARAAKSDLPILIVGATGTGKERVAQFIHQQSGRSGNFHAINCATIPADVAESQLFGHKQGAFTGAQHANVGHFRAADRGTLFLDEIVELPLAVQAKLLRALQEHAVIPLGDTKTISVDVRIIASCQKRLSDGAEAQPLRADLRARLSGLTVELPTLAARKEEIPFLFMSFLRQHAIGEIPRVDGKLVERLCLYSWPRNVREIELLARELLALHAQERSLKRAHLPASIRDAGTISARDHRDTSQHDRECLAHALRASLGNVSRAATTLGISRAKAYRLLAGEPVATFVGKYSRGEPTR